MLIIILFLSAAGFLAGFVDAVAGGGGLITLPALLVANVPPHLALGTNKFQSMCGTSFALANFARKAKVVWKIAAVGIPFALVGSMIGAKLVLTISQAALAKVIVILLPPVALLVFFSKGIISGEKDGGEKGWLAFVITPIICFGIGMYDGFLGPGTGTFLILALVLFSKLNLVNASATAKTFNLASNVGAFVTFVMSGYVYYPYALAMAAANIAGNIIGSHYAMKHGSGFIRKILLVSLTLLFVYLAWKYF